MSKILARVLEKVKTLGTNRENAILVTLLILGLSIRIAFSFFLPWSLSDSRAYDRIAQNFLSGNGFSESSSAPFLFSTIRDKGYPLFLSIIYNVFGHSHMAVYTIQAGLSTLTTFLVYRLGRDLFGTRIGLLAGGISALYLPAIAYVGTLLTETTYAFLIITGTWLVFQRHWHSGLSYALAGSVMGMAVITRTEGIAYAILLTAFVILQSKSKLRSLAYSFFLAIGLALIVFPIIVWNYNVTDRFMLRDPDVFLTTLRLATGYHDFSDRLYGAIAFSPNGLSENERAIVEKQIIEDYFHEITSNPIGFARFRLYQLLRLWTYGSDGLPVTNMPIFDLLKKGDWGQFIMRMTVFLLFGPVMIALIVIGIAISIPKVPNSIILLIYPLFTTAFGVFFYTTFRYGLPGQILLIPVIAVGIDWLWSKVQANRERQVVAINHR